MENSSSDGFDKKVVIGDRDQESARLHFEEPLEKDAYYDTAKGYVKKGYTAISSGEHITLSLAEDDFSVTAGVNDYYYRASLQEGVLHLDVRLLKPAEDGTIQRSPLMPHFANLVDHTFNYFAQQNKGIQEMYGGWGPTHGGMLNTNWEVFQRGINSGLSLNEAALLTPTGKSAARHGYTDVKVTLVDPNPEWDEEEGADVHFYRPV